jgi:hypothetical protein
VGKVASLSSYIHWIKKATNPLDPLTTSEPAATNPISSRYGPEAFIQTALELLRPLPQKRGGPHGPERAQACRDLLSASFSLPREKLALLFVGQLKTRQAPGTSSLGLPHPRPRRPKRLVQTLDTLRTLGSFPSQKAFNTTTIPQLPKYVSAAFGSLDLSWKLGPPPQRLRRHCCHRSKPKSQTDDIFLAQILGHTQKIFTFESAEPSLLGWKGYSTPL